MQNITLHDIYPYLYIGMAPNSTTYNSYSVKGFPVGGIKYFLHKLLLDIPNIGHTACFFDSGRSFRKKILPQYKSGRRMQPEIVAQAKFLYDYLQKCDIPCYKAEGYEADDLIHSAVVFRDKSVYPTATVCGSDYDLTHNVDYDTNFQTISSQTNSATWRTFSNAVVQGKTILLNTISAYKTFTGCSSDEIPSLQGKVTGEALYDLFCKVLQKQFPDGVDPEIARKKSTLVTFLNNCKGKIISEETAEAYIKIADATFPAEVSGEYKGVNIYTLPVDKKLKLGKLMAACGEYHGLRVLGFKSRPELDAEEVEEFRRWAKELATGEFMADNSLPMTSSNTFTSAFDLRRPI